MAKTLTQLAQELERIKETAKDYVVPITKLEMTEQGALKFVNGAAHEFNLNKWSSQQLSQYTDIPKNYFDRIQKENPALLSRNVNHAFDLKRAEEKPDTRMLRTLDGNIRAFLSSRYRRLDAYDLLNETLPIMLDHAFTPTSCEITDKRLYIKATTDKLQTEVKKGDVVRYGVMMSTSDTGAGAFRIEPFIERLVCLNGMVMDTKVRKYHVGKDQSVDDATELFSDATKALTDKAFFSQVRDIMLGTMLPEVFEREVNKLRHAANVEIKNFALEKVVELAMNETGVKGEGNKQNILAALASGNQGAGLTMWGLANAFTAAAKSETEDYDAATEMQRAGGLIINLSESAWKRVAC